MTKKLEVSKFKLQVNDPAKQFSYKKLGAILILQIGEGADTKTFSKKVTAEEFDIVSRKVLLYNKKPTQTNYDTIVKLMTPEAQKKKLEQEKTQAAVKGIKKQVKKATKAANKTKTKEEKKDFLAQLEEFLQENPEGVAKLQIVLDKFKPIAAPVIPIAAPKEVAMPRRGEY